MDEKQGKKKQPKRPKTPKQQINTPPTKPLIPAPDPPSTGQRHFVRTLSVLKVLGSGSLALIAVVGGWALLKPNVQIDPYVQLNPDSPFSERWKITNANQLFDIYDVSLGCDVVNARTEGQVRGSVTESIVASSTPYIKKIAAGTSATADCPLDRLIKVTNSRYVGGQINLVVRFTPALYLKQKAKSVQFTGQVDNQGRMQWTY